MGPMLLEAHASVRKGAGIAAQRIPTVHFSRWLSRAFRAVLKRQEVKGRPIERIFRDFCPLLRRKSTENDK